MRFWSMIGFNGPPPCVDDGQPNKTHNSRFRVNRGACGDKRGVLLDGDGLICPFLSTALTELKKISIAQ